jgi:predicted transcriptional regulator of viral defense system
MERTTVATLIGVAADNGGYVPTRCVVASGIPAARLVTLAARGGLERVRHGLYRIPNFPFDRNDDLILATLWANDRGAISHETALQFYELADVNPVAIDLTIPKAYRIGRAGGAGYRVHREDLATSEIALVDGVRIVSVNRAIGGAIKQGVGSALINQAIDTARKLGRITKKQESELKNQLLEDAHA